MRFSTLRIAVLFAGFVLAVPSHAQDEQSAEPAQEDEVLEEVIVVGSRVRRSNLDSPSPVIVFDASELKAAGITTLGEFSRYLPQNAAIASPGFLRDGTAGFNLRGIGLDATLTLVNGRRVAPYGASGGEEPFVDINAIPVAAIDRIEILTDGASAIYGSEAVAGVVNIVTLQRIEGITAEGGYLTTSEGDGDEWDLNMVGGWSDADTSITGTLSWFDGDPIWSRDRDWASSLDLSEVGGFLYGSSASSPPSLFLLETERLLADPACPTDSPTAQLQVATPGREEYCVFNFWHFTTLQQPSERLGMTASFRHDFRPGPPFLPSCWPIAAKLSQQLPPPCCGISSFPPTIPTTPMGKICSWKAAVHWMLARGVSTTSQPPGAWWQASKEPGAPGSGKQH